MNSNRPEDNRLFIHRIDDDERIVYVNEDWLSFARENQWAIDSASLLGTPLPEYIADPETRHIYRLLIARARVHAGAIRLDYRCDSPECRRFLAMEIEHDLFSGNTEFRSRMTRLEARPPVRLLRADAGHRSADVLNLCGWCKRAHVHNQWIEVEAAVHDLGLFDQDPLPRLSHGICPTCSQTLQTKGIG